MKTILFTGARSGIARSVIQKLLNKDYYIYVTVHTEKELERVKEIYKNCKNVKCFKIDVTNEKDREILKELDIDILVSNAAVGMGGSLIELPIDHVRYNFEVNVFSYFEIIQIVISNMIKKNRGKIINMASLAGMIPIPFLGSYSATKASIIKITEAMKQELKLKKSNIQICLIEPGLYQTGFNQWMFLNKYKRMDESSYFQNELDIIRKRENILLYLFEKRNLHSITKEIVKCIESNHPKFIYRAPILQVVGVKLYNLFFE